MPHLKILFKKYLAGRKNFVVQMSWAYMSWTLSCSNVMSISSSNKSPNTWMPFFYQYWVIPSVSVSERTGLQWNGLLSYIDNNHLHFFLMPDPSLQVGLTNGLSISFTTFRGMSNILSREFLLHEVFQLVSMQVEKYNSSAITSLRSYLRCPNIK